MKKLAPMNMLIASTLLLSNNAWSQAIAEDHNVQNLIALEKVVEIAEDKNSYIGKMGTMIDKLCEPLNERHTGSGERDREIKHKGVLGTLSKELDRYRIRHTFGDFENLIDTKYFSSGTSYQYVVEPAFRNGEQLRKDIWSFNSGISTATRVAFGANTTIRITFVRSFGGKNPKWDAIKACPYFITKTPRSTNDIKTKFKNRDSFRFEVIGSTGVSTAKILAGEEGLASAGGKTEAVFMIDLFKHDETRVRARLLGIRNSGELNVGFSLKTEDPWSFIRGKIREFFTAGVNVGFRKTLSFFSLTEKYPLDTMMIDYLYKFETPKTIEEKDLAGRTDTGEAALEELIGNIKKVGFAGLFFPNFDSNAQKDLSLAEKLLEKMKISEDLAKADLERYRTGKIKANQMRVRTLFKGRMQSDLLSGNGKVWVSAAVSKKGIVGSLNSFVTSYDENMNARYYFLDNTYRKVQDRLLLGRYQSTYANDFDVVVLSDKNRNVGKISDIVVKSEFQQSDLSAGEISDIKNSLARSLPENLKNDPKFESYFPTTKQTGAYLSHRYVFGHGAFSSIASLNREVLADKITKFLTGHPDEKQMHISSPASGNKEGPGTFAQVKAYEIMDILNPTLTPEEQQLYKAGSNISNVKSMQAFEVARKEPLFEKYLVGEFFASILPKDESKKLFGLRVDFSSSEKGTQEPLVLGDLQVSTVYEAVAFLKNVISDPTLDLDIVASDEATDELTSARKGTTIPLPTQIVTPAN